MPLLLRPPLAAINRAHPANHNLLFSYAATPSFAAFDLLNRQFGTQVNSPTQVYDPIIGPALRFRTGATTDAFTFPHRQAPTSRVPFTFAVVATLNNVGGNNLYFQNSTSSAGVFFGNQNSGTVQLGIRSLIVLTAALPVTTGVPYLLVGSLYSQGSSILARMMSVRLDTGLVATATSSNASVAFASGGNGTYVLGNIDLARSAGADIAACLLSNRFMSLGEMLAWSRDPWGPWRTPLDDVGFASSAGTTAPGPPPKPILFPLVDPGTVPLLGIGPRTGRPLPPTTPPPPRATVTKESGYVVLNASPGETSAGITKESGYVVLNASPGEASVVVTKLNVYVITQNALLRPYLSINL